MRQFWVILAISLFAVAAAAQPPSAKRTQRKARAWVRPPIPAEHWHEDSKRTLAQAMVGEAAWHRPDHVAIAWVLARRWKRYYRVHQDRDPMDFTSFIRRYSSPLKQKHKRALWVQSLPWRDVEAPYSRHWRKVRNLVETWGEGRVGDPCPRADHWGGTMDRPVTTMSPVHCGPTRNIFYRAPVRGRS